MTAEPFPSNQPPDPGQPPAISAVARIWADLVRAGWGEAVLRYATHGLLLLGLVAVVLMRQFNLGFVTALAEKASLGAPVNTAAVEGINAPTATPDPLEGAEVIGDL